MQKGGVNQRHPFACIKTVLTILFNYINLPYNLIAVAV